MNVKVQNKNILPIDYNKYTTSGTYGYYKLTNIEEDLIISISDKDTSVSMTGIFFGFSGAGADNSSGTQWIMSNGTQISTTLSNLYTSSGTTTKLKYFSFYPNNRTTFDKIFSRYNIQVEKGTATPYVAHEEQNLPFTFSSGQALMQGGMLTDSGVYNIRQRVVLNGTENWNARANTSHTFQMGLASVSGICSHYSYMNAQQIDTKNGIYLYGTNVSIVTDLNCNSVDDFKTFLAQQYNNGTPVVIEVVKSTPTTTAYTSTQQSQYNAVQQAYSYAEQTNISSTSTDLPADLEVEAVTYSSSDDYTENEMQIGTWLGKPLYRKVIKFESLPNNTYTNIYHFISNLEHFTKIYGFVSNSNGLHLPLPYVAENNYTYTISISAGITSVYIGTDMDWSDRQLNNNYIVLEYTKTTD